MINTWRITFGLKDERQFWGPMIGCRWREGWLWKRKVSGMNELLSVGFFIIPVVIWNLCHALTTDQNDPVQSWHGQIVSMSVAACFVEGGNRQHYASPHFLVHYTVCLTSCTKFNRKYEIYKARKQRVRVIYGISLTDVWSSWENIPEQKLEWTFLTPNELLGYPQSFTGWSLAERKRKLGRILPHLTPTRFTFTTEHRA